MNQTAAPLTRRQAREIERRTGVRPVATAAQVELADAVAASFQHDTAFIERNEVASLVSIVPTEAIDRSAVESLREVPEAFAGRGMTVRAQKPASLVAKQRRRAAAGFAAAASAAAVASTGLLVPVAQSSNVPAAHSADLAAVADKAAADVNGVPASTPEAQTVVTTVVEAPAAVVDRADTASFDTADVEETQAPVTTATETEGQVETSTAAASESGSASADVQTASGEAAAAPAAGPSQYVAGSSIVETARQMIGIPYTGGNTPEQGFDCSGLVQYVYGLHGISLGRSVGAQAAAGTIVSDPQPGDLVVMLGGGHIAIYTGNGNIIDAPDYGRSVLERPIWDMGAVDYFVRIG